MASIHIFFFIFFQFFYLFSSPFLNLFIYLVSCKFVWWHSICLNAWILDGDISRSKFWFRNCCKYSKINFWNGWWEKKQNWRKIKDKRENKRNKEKEERKDKKGRNKQKKTKNEERKNLQALKNQFLKWLVKKGTRSFVFLFVLFFFFPLLFFSCFFLKLVGPSVVVRFFRFFLENENKNQKMPQIVRTFFEK